MSTATTEMTDNTGQAVPTEGAASQRLQDVLAEHQPYGLEPGWACTVAAAWREACTIHTVDQLDALPHEAVVRSGRSGNVFERYASVWLGSGTEMSFDPDQVPLPALLLWHPDWASS